jgi:hypothetical protein
MPNRPALFIVFLFFLTGIAFAQSPGEPTLWEHNGSVVYLIANGFLREFYYKEPRQGMIEAGTRPGALLFRGQSNNRRYSGTAFIFDRRCGRFPYQVSGPILDNFNRVVLTGRAPRVGANCRIEGYLTDTLEFTLLPSEQPPLDSESAPEEPLESKMAPQGQNEVPAHRFVGEWVSLDTDSRRFHIVQTRGGWTMTAPDLTCTIRALQVRDNEDDTTLADVESECNDTTTYASGQMKVFRGGNYLVVAERVSRRIDEKDGTTETLKDPEMFVYSYRRAQ